MNRHDDIVGRLARGARRAALPQDAAPPPGFSTRLLASLRPGVHAAHIRRLQWSSLAVASLLCASALIWGWTAPTPDDVDSLAIRLTLETLVP